MRTREHHLSRKRPRLPCTLPSATALPTTWALPAPSNSRPPAPARPPAALDAEAEEWPAWLAAADDDMLDALASLVDEEIERQDPPQPLPAVASLPNAAPPIEGPRAKHATKRRKRTPPDTAMPAAPPPPVAPVVAPPPPSKAAGSVPSEPEPSAAPPPPCAPVSQSVSLEDVLHKLPPALFNRSDAMTEYRAAYRTYRMGAARGAAGELPCEVPKPSAIDPGSASETGAPSQGAARRSPVEGGGRTRALHRLAEAVRLLPDFSQLLPADYRQRYGAWRSGSAVGAIGETGAAAATIEVPRHAWVDEVSSIADDSWTKRVLA